ncbi:mitochondrial inner membrane COX18 [Pelobates cultripes]|uniref:Mitochondrial inner membrane COX18 n=1 Tax=Pelobates cultripes TaxID=61616 RepID=A0AAD1SM53_PELCU|nr:mitochondrial inner membrane COX18 [Pelobates cultripes]
MAICRCVTNRAVWFKSFTVHLCYKPIHAHYIHTRVCGSLSLKSYNLGLNRHKPFTSAIKSHASSRSSFFGHSLSWLQQSRSIVLSAPLSSTSPGNPNSGHGLYEVLADSAPVHLAENVLVTLQEATGLPWWANIICATIALRTVVTLPLSVYQMHILAKVEKLQPEIEQLTRRLRYEVSVYGKQHGWNDKVAKFHFTKNLRRIISDLYVRDNCHPFKASLIIWIQIPMWLFVSLALRKISFCTSASSGGEALHRQLEEGGALWFPDLTLPDATWILPVSLGLVNLLNLEIFALRKINLSKFQKILTNFIRMICILMVPVAASVPSSMALYWFSSSCVGLTHNLLLRSPTLRRIFKIPKLKSDSDTPYKDILSAFVSKYLQKK